MDGQVIAECQILSVIVINILRKSAPWGLLVCREHSVPPRPTIKVLYAALFNV